MLDEIEFFFDELRTPFDLPEDLMAVDPETGGTLPFTARDCWTAAMAALDDIEARLLRLYEFSAVSPSTSEFLDRVIAIMRRSSPPDERMSAIGRLFQEQVPRTH